MQVGHAPARPLSNVGHHPVAVQVKPLSLSGDDGEDVSHHSGVCPVHLGYQADVLFGDYQGMGGRLGLMS